MVEIVSIGDELLNGQTVNTNAAWMGAELTRRALALDRVVTVADTREAILDALNRASNRAQVVLMTGGLGPTKDDITKSTLCEFFEDDLVRHHPTLERIEEYAAHRNFQLLEVHRQQADLPSKCKVLLNTRGTAQGMWFEKDEVIYVSMPGVPYEMRGIMNDHVFELLIERFVDGHIIEETALTIGVGESTIANTLSDWEERVRRDGMSIAYLPSPGMVKVRVSARGKDEGLRHKVHSAMKEFVDRAGDWVYGRNRDTIEGVVGRLLSEQNKTLATAESCTGGYVSHRITSVAGSSAYYLGGFVTYSNEMKIAQLGVESSTLEQNGAVSEAVVKEMAQEARRESGADLAVATSGVAGPGGGTDENPVGLVWIAVADEKGVWAQKFNFGKSRQRNITVSGQTALNLVRLRLLGRI